MRLFAGALVVVYLGDEVNGWVRAGQVFGYAERFGVVVDVAELAWESGLRADWEGDGGWDEG